jgi:hypothetical protein
MKVALSGGTPVILAATPVGPGGIAVDAASIYWSVNNTVMKMPLGGGTPTVLATVRQGMLGGRGLVQIYGLVIDASFAYFAAVLEDSFGHAAVMKVPLAGGEPTVIASDQAYVWAIAIDSTHAYWLDAIHNTVMRAPK